MSPVTYGTATKGTNTISLGEDGFFIIGSEPLSDAISAGGAGHVGALSLSLAVNLEAENAQASIFVIGSTMGPTLELKKGGAGQETTAILSMEKYTSDSNGVMRTQGIITACQRCCRTGFGDSACCIPLWPGFSFLRIVLHFF